MATQDLNAMAFPKLSDEQIAQLGQYAGASTKTFRAGEALSRAVCTGIVLRDSPHWSLKRQPFLLETSRPGVFAARLRSGSVKRVASAVGEGSMSVQFVHEYLKTM